MDAASDLTKPPQELVGGARRPVHSALQRVGLSRGRAAELAA
jgi:hypothetical protein